MSTLAADKPREYGHGDFLQLPVVAADIIYEGAAVGLDSSGNAKPLGTGEEFFGFAESRADNSAGAAEAINVRVRKHGVIKLAVTGVNDYDDVGKAVYASDDDTFTLTKATDNAFIGKVVQWLTGTTCWVEYDVTRPVAKIADPTDLATSIVAVSAIIDALESAGIIHAS